MSSIKQRENTTLPIPIMFHPFNIRREDFIVELTRSILPRLLPHLSEVISAFGTVPVLEVPFTNRIAILIIPLSVNLVDWWLNNWENIYRNLGFTTFYEFYRKLHELAKTSREAVRFYNPLTGLIETIIAEVQPLTMGHLALLNLGLNLGEAPRNYYLQVKNRFTNYYTPSDIIYLEHNNELIPLIIPDIYDKLLSPFIIFPLPSTSIYFENVEWDLLYPRKVLSHRVVTLQELEKLEKELARQLQRMDTTENIISTILDTARLVSYVENMLPRENYHIQLTHELHAEPGVGTILKSFLQLYERSRRSRGEDRPTIPELDLLSNIILRYGTEQGITISVTDIFFPYMPILVTSEDELERNLIDLATLLITAILGKSSNTLIQEEAELINKLRKILNKLTSSSIPEFAYRVYMDRATLPSIEYEVINLEGEIRPRLNIESGRLEEKLRPYIELVEKNILPIIKNRSILEPRLILFNIYREEMPNLDEIIERAVKSSRNIVFICD